MSGVVGEVVSEVVSDSICVVLCNLIEMKYIDRECSAKKNQGVFLQNWNFCNKAKFSLVL